jgi:hypothetical protein
MVKKMNWASLNYRVNQHRKSVNEQLARERGSNRKKRSRKRSDGELQALDLIAMASWKKAEEKGKRKKEKGKRKKEKSNE